MDFSFTEEQEAVRELAGKILESGGGWDDLARAGLTGIAVPEEYGGGGCGFVELCVLLEQVGRHTAAVPAYASLVLGADTIARHADADAKARYLPGAASGELILTAAVRDSVPWGAEAARVLVPSGGTVRVVDCAQLEKRPLPTMSGLPCAEIDFERATPESSFDADVSEIELRATAALCVVQLGVSDRALHMTAEHVARREQFGRPIGSFQAVQQRIADAYVDVECMRWTSWQAAWRIASGLSAEREMRIAKFWAAEGGARVAATAQQLHGGLGVDLDYPLHRYFLWTKELELTLGPAPVQLAALGEKYR